MVNGPSDEVILLQEMLAVVNEKTGEKPLVPQELIDSTRQKNVVVGSRLGMFNSVSLRSEALKKT